MTTSPPPRHHADWLAAYLDFTRASESPLQFHFWTGVATIAGALRGKVWRDEKTFRWSPNFYIVLVGPAGIAQKSTSMNQGIRLLEKVPGINIGPSSATWQRLAQYMQEVAEEVTFITAGNEVAKFNISCVTLAISELGTFLKLASEGFSEVLIDMWDGQVTDRPWSHSTVTSTKIAIPNPWLNMIACTTPSWLQEHFPVGMIGGGLTSRILFIYGDKKRRLVAYPSQEFRGRSYEQAREALIEDLIQIGNLCGPVAMGPEAMQWGSTWYEQLWSHRPPHLASDRFDSYIARKQVFLHKLALVRMAATGNDLVIGVPHLEWADAILSVAEADMHKVFSSIGLVDQARQIEAISRTLRTYRRLTGDELYGFLHNSMSLKEFRDALEAGVSAGLFEIEAATVAGRAKRFVRLRGSNEPAGRQ